MGRIQFWTERRKDCTRKTKKKLRRKEGTKDTYFVGFHLV
jgi:hypothetical protein